MKLKDLFDHILVINLDKDKGRLSSISTQIHDRGFTFQRIPAIYGKNLPNIDSYISRLKTHDSANKPGVIGCGLSHRKAWQTILDNGWDNALILEDDAHFTEFDKYSDILDIDIPSFDIFFLGHSKSEWPRDACSRIPIPAYSNKSKNNIIHFNSNDMPMGLWAYSMSKDIVKECLDNYKLDIPVDVYLITDNVDNFREYGIIPSLITHCYEHGSSTSFPSTLNKMLVGKKSHVNHIDKYYIGLLVTIILLLFPVNFYLKYRLGLVLFLIFFFLLYKIYFMIFYKPHIDKYDQHINKYFNLSPPSLIGTDEDIHYDPFGNTWLEEDKRTLRKLMTMIFESRIDISIFYGTLLGWTRHNKYIIPWDDDADMCAHITDRPLINEYFKKSEGVDILSMGTYDKIFFKDSKPIPGYKHKYPFVDIFYYEINNGILTVYEGPRTNHIYISTLYEDRLPTFIDTFEDIPVNVPTEYICILDNLYPKWKSVCKSTGWNHRLEYKVDDRYILTESCDNLLL